MFVLKDEAVGIYKHVSVTLPDKECLVLKPKANDERLVL